MSRARAPCACMRRGGELSATIAKWSLAPLLECVACSEAYSAPPTLPPRTPLHAVTLPGSVVIAAVYQGPGCTGPLNNSATVPVGSCVQVSDMLGGVWAAGSGCTADSTTTGAAFFTNPTCAGFALATMEVELGACNSSPIPGDPNSFTLMCAPSSTPSPTSEWLPASVRVLTLSAFELAHRLVLGGSARERRFAVLLRCSPALVLLRTNSKQAARHFCIAYFHTLRFSWLQSWARQRLHHRSL